jgi:hypothetical protein
MVVEAMPQAAARTDLLEVGMVLHPVWVTVERTLTAFVEDQRIAPPRQ